MWLQSPTSGIVGSQVSPQPEIAVEDANNNIVSSDFSSVTLSVSSGPTGGTLSNTCSGVESYGVVPFGDCSLSVAGTYVLKASDSNGLTPATSSSFVVSPAPAAKLVFTTSAQTGVASASANLGLPGPDLTTVQEEDPFGNPVNGAATVNLASTSSGAIFALNCGRHHSHHVCVHPGRVLDCVLLLRGHGRREPDDHGVVERPCAGDAGGDGQPSTGLQARHLRRVRSPRPRAPTPRIRSPSRSKTSSTI